MTINKGQEMMIELVKLKKIANETHRKKDWLIYQRHMAVCIEQFDYLIKMRTGKYKSFSNYEDLNQEGREALIKAMITFNPKKGNWFSWAHQYISTRVSRSANLHTTIRYPLKVAKETPPHKETNMPELIEERFCPDLDLERSQTATAVHNVLAVLNKTQKDIISLTYGFDGNKPLSPTTICRKLRLTRSDFFIALEQALLLMKEQIKL